MSRPVRSDIHSPDFAVGALSPNSPLPLHYQLRERIVAAIVRGHLKAGDAIPPEEVLAAEAGVSRTTVRQALITLVHEGFIERRRGLGTRVAAPRIQQELSALTGFAEDMLSRGVQPLANVLSAGFVRADAIVADQLHVPQSATVFRVERVRLGDDRPILFDISYLPEAIGRRLEHEDLVHRPIFSLLEENYGIQLGEADYRIQAVAATRKIAGHLGVAPATPLLMIERTTYALDGSPVDYENMFYPGDRMSYSLRLKRRRLKLDEIPSSRH